MSKLRFEVLDSKLIEGYMIQSAEEPDWLEGQLVLKDVTNPLIKKAVEEYELAQNIKIDPEMTMVRDEALTGLVVLKHCETDTIIVVKMPSLDHDGNPFFFSEGNVGTPLSSGCISDILGGVTKYGTDIVFEGKYIVLEPNDKCWVDYAWGCREYLDREDKHITVSELTDLVRKSSFLEILINDYKGKIIYTAVDDCGGIMEIKSLDNLDNLDHVDASFLVWDASDIDKSIDSEDIFN